MVGVGVIGHTGRLGKPLVEILNKHPNVEIAYTESRKEGIKGNLEDCELVFLALPEGESEDNVKKIGSRIIDLSIDHRNNNDWVYGLPELNKDIIKNARYVSNPGCYATSIILGLAPLCGLVSNIHISSTSGISGAGKEAQKEDNFLIYKEGREHKHIAEIEKTLNLEKILFVPQRIDTADKGIISTIFTKYNGYDEESLYCLYEGFYKSEPFIRMKTSIETKNVLGTNYCDIKLIKFEDNLIIISAIDNIIKGGAGQAIQNFNIMYGFYEKTALL